MGFEHRTCLEASGIGMRVYSSTGNIFSRSRIGAGRHEDMGGGWIWVGVVSID